MADRIRAEQVVEYQLSRHSVYRGQRTGLDAAAIIAFLEQVSTVPLPQNMRRSLEQWGVWSSTMRCRCFTRSMLQRSMRSTLNVESRLLARRAAPTAHLVAMGLLWRNRGFGLISM